MDTYLKWLSIGTVVINEVTYTVLKEVFLGRTIIKIVLAGEPTKTLVDTTFYHGVNTRFDSSAVPVAYASDLSAFVNNAQTLQQAKAKTLVALKMC